MTYTIEPTFWTGTETQSPDGYNAFDYLQTSPPTFETAEQAETWLQSNYLGPDEDEVGVEWEIVGE